MKKSLLFLCVALSFNASANPFAKPIDGNAAPKKEAEVVKAEQEFKPVPEPKSVPAVKPEQVGEAVLNNESGIPDFWRDVATGYSVNTTQANTDAASAQIESDKALADLAKMQREAQAALAEFKRKNGG